MCHVGVVRDGWPVVLGMTHGRNADILYLHGSAAAGVFRDLRGGSKLCVTMTLLDGLVLARSARNHSMNYRSAVVFGEGEALSDPAEKLRALRVVMEHSLPGRWDKVRAPSEQELAETGVWALPLANASCKVRSGPPLDPPQDAALPVWAGAIPVETRFGTPQPAPDLPHGITPGPDVVGRGRGRRDSHRL